MNNNKESLADLSLIKNAFNLLDKKLPSGLYYHTLEHTKDVLKEALYFASEDNLDPHALELLAIAAAYHDTGFIETLKNNEGSAAKLAQLAMQEAGGYTKQDQEIVVTMIMDTELRNTANGLRQVPTTELSKYLCDADLSNLGRDDFIEKAELLRLENGVQDLNLYFSGLIELLSGHQWFTPAGKKFRQAKLEENLLKLKKC